MTSVEYTYPFLRNATIVASKENYLNPKSLQVTHYCDCYGLPYRPLAKGDVNYVGGGLRTLTGEEFGTLYEYDSKDAINIKEEVCFIGHISSICWGHIITDSIARLWWLADPSIKNHLINLPIYYFSETPLSGNFLDFIKLLGIPINNLHRLNRVTHFESVYVPDVCFDNHRISLRYSKEYNSLINQLITRCEHISTPRKFYLIRENSNRQICSNEIRMILEKTGFECIFPERYSVPYQISLFHNAKCIVSEESSLSHNFIFCKPYTRVIILRKANTINIYQALINTMRNLNVTYIDCHLSIGLNQRHRGPFFLYANENFCNYFRQNKRQFPYIEFNEYIQITKVAPSKNTTHPLDSHYKEIIQEILSSSCV